MNPKRAVLAGLFALFLSAVVPPSAHAWGCKGHQTVALIAESHLSPEARQMVEKLLRGNPIDPQLRRWCGNATPDLLVDASTWPDDVRNERRNGPWHYIDIPRGKHKGSLDDFCGTEGCVARAIAEQRSLLKDKSAAPAKRADALRYLIHFVGDLHQPLHTINNGDNGGNCVAVQYLHHEPLANPAHPEREDYSPNLHQIWDTEIVERDMEVSNPHRYADELDEKFRPQIASWEAAGIHVDNWVWEVHERAETEVYDAFPEKIAIEPDVKPKGCSDNNHIGKRMFEKHLVAGDAYQNRAAKAVETGIVQAGVRLAMILNDAAKANP
ncbi:MAG TPA: S1/P1 nuclease [Candidatus Angelobacter sp.]|nr:S1/P1 nuclease [Candidatus Angelobacter sp.]